MANKENYIKDLDACTAPVSTDEFYLMSNTQGNTASMKISVNTLLTNTAVCKTTSDWLRIEDLKAAAANGAAAGSIETSNGQSISTFDFDQGNTESVCFSKKMPSTWYANSGVSLQFIWTSTATTGNVQWGAQSISYTDGDPLDAAFGTAVEINEATPATANTIKYSAVMANVVASGTSTGNKFLTFRLFRNAANNSDDLAVDARLLGVKVLYGECQTEET